MRTPAPIALLAAIVLSACRGQAPAPRPADVPPGVRSLRAEAGVEARFWTIDATLGPFLAALDRASLDRSSIHPDDRRAWHEAGLRLIDIETDGVDPLEDMAPHADALRRLWLGQPTRWTSLAEHDDPPRDGRPGPSLQLLTRSWVEPDARLGPVIRVELAITRAYPAGPRGDRAATPIGGLLLSQVLEPGRALLIVPAAPGEVWTAPPETPDAPADPWSMGPDVEPPPTSEPSEAGLAPLPAPMSNPTDAPPAPVPPQEPTVGEMLLLRQPDSALPRPARRTVIAIVPRWPGDATP